MEFSLVIGDWNFGLCWSSSGCSRHILAVLLLPWYLGDDLAIDSQFNLMLLTIALRETNR